MSRLTSALAALAVAFAAAPAGAQEASRADLERLQTLRAAPPSRGPVQGALVFDQLARGSLASGDADHAWRVRLRQGEVIRLDLQSDDFDPYLEVFRADERGPVAANDDNGVGASVNSRLKFQAPLAGDYFVTVRSVDGKGGVYELLARRRDKTLAPCNAAVGQSVTDALQEVDDGRNYARSCFFEGRQGQRVRVALDAEAFDAMVTLKLGDRIIAEDDDSGPGTNALLVRVLPATGLYEVVASAFALESEKGATFTLALAELPPPKATADIREIRTGAPQQGRFSEDNAVDELGRPYAVFEFTGVKDGRYGVQLEWAGESPRTASDVRLAMQAGFASPLGFASARSASTSGRRPAAMQLSFSESAKVLIRVSHLQPGGLGLYRLTITPADASKE